MIKDYEMCAAALYDGDVELVVHGYWDDSLDGITPYCSVCGCTHRCLIRTPPYCPNCGAKMDNEVPEMRYRLQRKQTVARPNILGNHSFPVYTWEWKDVAASNSKEALEQYMKDHAFGAEYKIIDTREAVSDESNTDF